MNLKPETLTEIDTLIARYPVKKSAMLMVLHLIQDDIGYISPEAMEWTAAKLEVEPIAVLEVVTFYPMYRRAPIGRRHVKVCRTLPCALTGAYKVCETLQKEFNCKLGETSADGNYTIEFVECIADCGLGPVVQVDDRLYEKIKPEEAAAFAASIKAETEGGPDTGGDPLDKESPRFNG